MDQSTLNNYGAILSYENAELKIQRDETKSHASHSSGPDDNSSGGNNDNNSDKKPKLLKVVFCLEPKAGQQPYVFNEATLGVSQRDNSPQSVTLISIKDGKSDVWTANQACKCKDGDKEKGVVGRGQHSSRSHVATLLPPYGWNTNDTPLAITFSIEWDGTEYLTIEWLELGYKSA